MPNLDRFSRPLDREFSSLSLSELQEQQHLNHLDIIDQFIRDYFFQYEIFPDAEDIQDIHYKLGIDLNEIEIILAQCKNDYEVITQ